MTSFLDYTKETSYQFDIPSKMTNDHIDNTIKKPTIPHGRRVQCLAEKIRRCPDTIMTVYNNKIVPCSCGNTRLAYNTIFVNEVLIREEQDSIIRSITNSCPSGVRPGDIVLCENGWTGDTIVGVVKDFGLFEEGYDKYHITGGVKCPREMIFTIEDLSSGVVVKISKGKYKISLVALGAETLETVRNKNKETKKEEKTMATKNTQIIDETVLASKLVIGDRLYQNVETLAHDYVLSKLTWWQKLTMSKKQKDMIVLVSIFGIVHAAKTGMFGMFDKKINHEALDIMTLACNHKIQTQLFSGIDTNVVKMLLTMPTIETTK